MKIRTIAGLALALAAVAPAYAQHTADIEDIARRTGLTTRQVRMVLGAPSAYAEYRTSYDYAEMRVKQALYGADLVQDEIDDVLRDDVINDGVRRDGVRRDDVDVDVDAEADVEIDSDPEGATTAPLTDDAAPTQQLRIESADDDRR